MRSSVPAAQRLLPLALALMLTPFPAAAAAGADATKAANAADAAMPDLSATDPMTHLKARLQEKLGASRLEATGASAYDLKVRTQPPPPPKTRVARAAPTALEAKVAAHRASAAAPAWSHTGSTGPAHWATLKPEYALCGSGTRQSPIDIRDGIAVQLETPRFEYRPTGFSVVDNGHTVRIKLGPGNTVSVMGRRYELEHIDFRRPSEARVDGRLFEMSAQLVHRDPEGRHAVVAVLLERGAVQPVLQLALNNLPLERHEVLAAPGALDPSALLPADLRYYTYMGSLTTPPCTEGVLWMVMQTPLQASAAQIDIFSRLYPMNARPVQQAAGRLIKQSE